MVLNDNLINPVDNPLISIEQTNHAAQPGPPRNSLDIKFELVDSEQT